MVFLEKKKRGSRIYLYLVQKGRVNGKPKRLWQIYIGPEDKIKERGGVFTDHDFKAVVFDFGLPVVLMQLAERLDLVNIINQCTTKRRQGLSVGEYVLIATLNRCIQPRSKNQVRKWFYSTYLQDLFPEIETYLDSMAYTNHFEYLTAESIEIIEEQINQKLVGEFRVKMDELMYDPTNFFTFINPKGQELPKHGHSKEGRHVLNLVGLSLFCTRDGGIPVMHRVYPGNVQDAEHFKAEYPRFLARLKKLGIPAPDITLVHDKGNISPEVFKMIDSSGIHWISSVRPSSHKDLQELTPGDFEMHVLPNGKEVGTLEFERVMHGKKRRLIVVYNPRRARWSGKNLVKKLEAKVEVIHGWFEDRLNKRKWRDPEKVKEKIESIIKTKAHFKFIEYEVSGEHGNAGYSVKINKEAVRAHLETLGKSFYMTNRLSMSPEEVVWLYRQQFTVERAFKYLKNPSCLKVTPVYHRKDECIRGHLFTCVLGLLLLTLLSREVNATFPGMSLPGIVESLSEIRVVQVKFPGSRRKVKKIVKTPGESDRLAKFFQLEQFL